MYSIAYIDSTFLNPLKVLEILGGGGGGSEQRFTFISKSHYLKQTLLTTWEYLDYQNNELTYSQLASMYCTELRRWQKITFSRFNNDN